jgi:hypothetical protein
MRRTLFIIFAALTALASLSSANPLCTTNTVAYYQANYTDASNGCTVGNLIFFNFNYSGTSQGATAPANSQVEITPESGDPTSPGLVFSAPNGDGGSLWSVSGPSTLANPLYIDSTMSLTVADMNSAPLINAASLDFNNQFSVSGQGVSDIVAETVVFDGGTAYTKMGVDSANGPFTSSTTFDPVSFLRVTKDLSVFVARPLTGTNTGSASINQFTETFSEDAPEPVSMLLLGSGLGSLFFLRRRS